MHQFRAAVAPLALAIALVAAPSISRPASAADVERGAYIFDAAGCAGCHTDSRNGGQLLAGGRALATPFGTFISPNITASPAGIGDWSDEDFIKAMREGISPGGQPYYPSFPFTSFTQATTADLLDLKAYIFSLPQSPEISQPHDLKFPFSFRPLMYGWRLLNFRQQDFIPDPTQSDSVNRGAYLVEALSHCAECHTPRTALGAINRDMWMAGTLDGPEGDSVPNITPDAVTGIGDWSPGDLVSLLKTGLTPEFDSVGGSMGEVVQQGTSRMTDEDLAAIVDYLLSLPPIENNIPVE